MIDSTDSEDAEIVSLNSILNQGPEFEPQWHAVGQESREEGSYYFIDRGTSSTCDNSGTMTSIINTTNNINAAATANVEGSFLPDTNQSQKSASCAHSRSSTLESIAHSDPCCSHQKSDRETAANSSCCSHPGVGSSIPPIAAVLAPGAVALGIVVESGASTELVCEPAPELPRCTEAAAVTNPAHVAIARLHSDPPCSIGAANQDEATTSRILSVGGIKPSIQFSAPARPRIHPCQHFQRHSFKAIQQNLVDTDEDEDRDEDLDDEEWKRSKGDDRRKMDILSALGIADASEEGPEDTPFNFFKNEPVIHSLPEQYRLQLMTRRNTVDGGTFSRSKGFGSSMEYDDQTGVVHLPLDFFEGYHRHHLGVDDSDSDGSDDSDDQTGYPRIKKRTMAADEDVAHLSPIPFSELPSLTNIGLCSHGIVKLSSNIRLLSFATCLQM